MNQPMEGDGEMIAYQSLPVPIMVIDPYLDSFVIRYLNEETERLLNINAEEAVGQDFFQLTAGFFYESQLDLKHHLDQVCISRENKKIPSCKFNFNGDGQVQYFDFTLSPLRIENGIVTQVVAVLYDVTEKIVAKQSGSRIAALIQDKNRFLYETQRVARNGTWEIDTNKQSIVWSDMLREIYEVSPDFQVDFTSALSFFKDDTSRRQLEGAVDEALRTGQIFDLELPVTTAKGNDVWLRITGMAEYDGEVCTRLYGVTQDITEKKKIGDALRNSLKKLRSLIQTVDGIVWEADATTFDFTFVSDQVSNILGYTAEEWLSDPHFWMDHIHPDDRDRALSYCITETRNEQNHTFDYRMVKSDGSIVWIRDLVSVIVQEDEPTLIRGIMVDITEAKLYDDLDNLEKRVLELNSKKGVETETVLMEYLLGLEKLFPTMKCSVLRVKGNKAYNWVTPSLPGPYVETINDFEIGPLMGSCGASAYLKHKVIVADIEADPKWERFKHLLLPYGLRSSWSYPVLDSEGNVMAVLGIYHYVAKIPSDNEAAIVERTVAILNMILENRINSSIIQQYNLLLTQGQELADFGTWQWDIYENIVTWSDVLYKIYGLNKSNFAATFESYLSMLHPGDKERVACLIKNVIETHTDVIFEERIIRPDGEQRILKSWGRLLLDDEGNPVKMIGACLDVTKAKATQIRLQEIAWLQSHVIRAPLARLLGLVDLLKNDLSLKEDADELLNHVVDSAHELDDVIKNISDRTIE